MAFCGNCGTKIDDNAKFCPGCGKAVEAPPATEQPKTEATNQPKAEQAQGQQTDFSAKLSALNNTADTTADYDKQDIETNKAMALLAYLSWLVLIPIFAAKNSKYARFHCNQGLVLAICEIIWWIGTAIINAICYAIAWWLGSIVSIVLGLVNIIFLVLLIVGIMNALNGKAKELPIIGKIKILK